MNDNDIINKFKDKKQIKWFIFDKLYPNEYKYLLNRFNNSKSIQESYLRIKYNIIEKPRCPICGNYCKLDIRNNKIFSSTCGNKICKDKIWHIKLKENLINKYGVENVFQLENIKNKIKETNIKKYGVEYSFQNKEIQNKFKKTMLEKYNCECSMHSDLIKNKYDFKKNKEKEYKTKKKNGTYQKSKQEDESYILLKEKYSDIKRQYKNKLYPFACDFYIPSLDLYIECNYHWTHGNKLFEGNNDDIIKLNNWKSKNTKYYNNAIYTWTILDIKKYNIAKKNNLNYKIFWNINELKKWINTL